MIFDALSNGQTPVSRFENFRGVPRADFPDHQKMMKNRYMFGSHFFIVLGTDLGIDLELIWEAFGVPNGSFWVSIF